MLTRSSLLFHQQKYPVNLSKNIVNLSIFIELFSSNPADDVNRERGASVCRDWGRSECGLPTEEGKIAPPKLNRPFHFLPSLHR